MTRRPFLSRGRLRIPLFICIVTLTVVGPTWAGQETARTVPAPPARAPSDLQSRLDALQARVDALEKDAAVADIRRELNAVRDDLAKTNATAPERTTPVAAPGAAWLALGIVGGLFVVAWALVSVLREGSRRQEAITSAVVKLAEASKEPGNEELDVLIAELKALVAKAAGGSLSLLGMLKRLLRIQEP